MQIPIEKSLRKRAQIELARLQDEVLEIFYQLDKPILHGGTSIWRCYNGVRFSEDLDFYGGLGEGLENGLRSMLESRGLSLDKFKRAPHVAYAKISNGYTTVKLELTEKNGKTPLLKGYRKTDGTEIDIYTLALPELIQEKMGAYKGRRFIRDIYDVYYLSGLLEGEVPGLKGFMEDLPHPVDEANLKTLIYSGVTPSFDEMVGILKGRCR